MSSALELVSCSYVSLEQVKFGHTYISQIVWESRCDYFPESLAVNFGNKAEHLYSGTEDDKR